MREHFTRVGRGGTLYIYETISWLGIFIAQTLIGVLIGIFLDQKIIRGK